MRLLPSILFCAAAMHAVAQEDVPPPGPAVNVHVVSASGSQISILPEGEPVHSGHTASSSGWGITLSYGLSRWLGMYTTADVAGEQSVTVPSEFTGDLALNQMDAGLRFQWPLAHDRVVPYGVLAFSYRRMQGPGTTPSDMSGTVSAWGPALTYGLGLQLFATKELALDLSYLGSSVKYQWLQFPDGSVGDTHKGPVPATRFEAGATWQIGPVGPATPAPSADTIALGERVRLHVGRSSVTGNVLLVHADTLILQQLRHDTAVQVPVPRECITTAWRVMPSHATKAGAVNGAFIGGIAISLIGAYLQTTEQTNPQSAGHVLLHFTLPGAVVGAAIGAVIGNNDTAVQRLWLPPSSSSAVGGSAACNAWHPPA